MFIEPYYYQKIFLNTKMQNITCHGTHIQIIFSGGWRKFFYSSSKFTLGLLGLRDSIKSLYIPTRIYKTRAESSIKSGVFHYYNKSENSDLCLMALDLFLHVLLLHHVMQFRNFYLLFLSVSQCQGIAPCYAILE